MRCSKCGAENPDRAKFCEECASPLTRRCASCETENSPNAKFCIECAAPLTAGPKPSIRKTNAETHSEIHVKPDQIDSSSAADGERKTVTALFADIKGSTALLETLDPEEAHAVVDPVLHIMVGAVHRYEGYVVQTTGDGIFALFGAPVAHEDHPQRALAAALRLQQELHAHGQQRIAQGLHPLEARVGVHTGEVVAHSVETDGKLEYRLVGHTANLASRMEIVAPTGSIAASEYTRKLCEGYFTFKPLGPMTVKGVSAPVAVYEVTGFGPLRTRLQRAAARGLTKFVGREREMEGLRRAFDQTKAGHGQIVAAMAEPGVGKSRLFFEFKAISQSGCMVLEAYSVSHGKASAYLPLLDLLQGYFKIAGEDDKRVRRAKVTGNVLTLDRSLEDTLPFLFSLLGIVEGDDPLSQMDVQVRKRRTLEAIKRILLRESLSQPLMVMFEDLHWIDAQTQEFLNLLADSIGTAKILLLVSYRPEYSHQWNSKTYYMQLRLDPLGRESAEEMLSALLGDGKDLIPLKRLISKRTEGTPFFMEEIVQALFEDGVLQRNGVVRLAKSMNAVKVPTTVQAVLGSRIDRLRAEEKELLQTVAVFGREFSLRLARRVTLTPDDVLERRLLQLQAGEFIYEQPATGDIEYVFKHALTQEVAYNALLIERRKLLHERAGQALESLFADQIDDHLTQIAHHYSHSDNIKKAIEYLGRAGQQALRRSAYTDAISSLSVAINLVQKLPDNPERVERELLLQMAVGRALCAINGYAAPEVERAFTRARELCGRLGDPPELFPTLYGLWVVHLVRGELWRSHELAEQLLRRARSAQDPELLLYAQMALGVISYWMGEFLAVKEHHENAIALYDPDCHRTLIFRYGGIDAGEVCLTHVAWALWQLGYLSRALQRSNEAIALTQKLSNPLCQAQGGFFVGLLHHYRRDASAVRETAEAVIALSTEQGFVQFLAEATTLRGWAMVQQGYHEEGIAQIREGLAASRAIGEELFRPYFLCLLAEAYMEMGRLDDGLDAVKEALAAADAHGDDHYRAEMHRLKAELLLRQNDSNDAEAHRCFERAIEVARKQSAKSLELRATTSLAQLLASRGRRDEARTMLAEIYGWFTEGFDTLDLKEAKILLDELST